MARRTPVFWLAASFVVVFLALDAILCNQPRLLSAGINYLFQIPAPLLALAACVWRASRVTGRARRLWWLLTVGLALWSTGMLLAIWEERFEHVPFEIASLSDFAYFFYGVPLLFALSTPVQGERLTLFAWLDGVQAIFAGYLTYVTIFATSPLFDSAVHPISATLLAFTYNVENVMLALSCVIRLMTSPKGEEHRFFRILCVFLTTYAVGVEIYNQSAIADNGATAWSAVADAPFLILALLVLFLPEEQPDKARAPLRKARSALFIDNGSPIFFTLALLALGMVTLRHHFLTGVIAVGVGLTAYGIRTTVLQIRYLNAQQELRSARDRLEEISLQDGLTGIANRRRFDQTLESEWHRAMRTHSSLSLLLIDLDYFKNLNDSYGHRYGDRCLIEVAAALRTAASRSGDLVARYGGEEFAAILPATTLEAARAIAIRMQEAVHALRITNPTHIGEYLSVSIGICTCDAPEADSPEMLIEAADRALYQAKQDGRNRVELAPMPQPVRRASLRLQGERESFPVQEPQRGESS